MENLNSIFTINLSNLFSQEMFEKIGLILLQLVAIIILAKLLFKFAHMLVDRLFEEKAAYDRQTKRRNNTLKGVLNSALRYTFYFVVVTMGLQVMGIPTTSILAGAGVFGLAIGFGAQSLVEDVIKGFFILFENQFTVGDYVKVTDVEGFVEEVGLRSTKIKNFDGDLHIIPNGKIEQVTNMTANFKRVAIDAPIKYEQDIDQAIKVLEKLAAEIEEEYRDIINEGPTVLGVQELAASSVNIRIVAMVKPEEVWHMGRVIRKKIKDRFDQVGIGIPYNHLTIVNKN